MNLFEMDDLFGEESSQVESLDISLLERRQRQFLVHSFLYYRTDNSLIDDHMYDHICVELGQLMKHPEAYKSKYYKICSENVDEAASGFGIQTYPPEIESTALRLLYHEQKPNIDFKDFIAKWGYGLINDLHTKPTKRKKLSSNEQ